MHIHLERSAVLPVSCSWAYAWPFVIGFAVAILALALYRRVTHPTLPSLFRRKASPIALDEKADDQSSSNGPRSLFGGVFALENLPITLTTPPISPRHVGVGLQVPGQPPRIQMVQTRRSSPSPPSSPRPRSSQPVSMAKIIMSRHTFRKPSLPSPKLVSQQSQRRPPPVSILPSRSPSPEDPERMVPSPAPIPHTTAPSDEVV
ncbi:hypothetical protein DL96DRAFT_1597208 [Flagelloscypha sp. PMI_526]|nr:hypothetical protein DL96DRAFT_1597208 [Flagelloscypha sp. PMI_526]